MFGKFLDPNNLYEIVYYVQFFTYAAEIVDKSFINGYGVVDWPISKKLMAKLDMLTPEGYYKFPEVLQKQWVWELKEDFNKKHGGLLLGFSEEYQKNYDKGREDLKIFPEDDLEVMKTYEYIKEDIIERLRENLQFDYTFWKKGYQKLYVKFIPKYDYLFFQRGRDIPEKVNGSEIIDLVNEQESIGYHPNEQNIEILLNELIKYKYVPDTYIRKQLKKLYTEGQLEYFQNLMTHCAQAVGEKDFDPVIFLRKPIWPDLKKKLDMLDEKGNLKPFDELMKGKFGNLRKNFDKGGEDAKIKDKRLPVSEINNFLSTAPKSFRDYWRELMIFAAQEEGISIVRKNGDIEFEATEDMYKKLGMLDSKGSLKNLDEMKKTRFDELKQKFDEMKGRSDTDKISVDILKFVDEHRKNSE